MATALEHFSVSANMEWRRRAIRMGAKGRVCEIAECLTILSRYNLRRRCSLHERKTSCRQP